MQCGGQTSGLDLPWIGYMILGKLFMSLSLCSMTHNIHCVHLKEYLGGSNEITAVEVFWMR